MLYYVEKYILQVLSELSSGVPSQRNDHTGAFAPPNQ